MTRLYKYAGPYIPRKHEKFRRWAFAFTERLARDPHAAGMTPEAAEELRAAFRVFNEAYNVAMKVSTRTTPTIAKMNAARKVLESMCRASAQQIKKNNDVSDAVKIELHLHLGRKRRRRVPRPDSRPTLNIIRSGPGQHELVWGDTNKGRGRSKPKDVAGLQLFAIVAPRAAFDVEQAQYVGTYTRQPIRVDWPTSAAGMTITYFGRWITNRGEEGPWSLPVMMQIAFGGPVLQTIERRPAPLPRGRAA